jgi:hypothetical protein
LIGLTAAGSLVTINQEGLAVTIVLPASSLATATWSAPSTHRTRRGKARNFASGYGVVVEHGPLTALDAGLMAEAKSYVDAAV